MSDDAAPVESPGNTIVAVLIAAAGCAPQTVDEETRAIVRQLRRGRLIRPAID